MWQEKVCELRKYKFVLGIENTIKTDYVTESTLRRLCACVRVWRTCMCTRESHTDV